MKEKTDATRRSGKYTAGRGGLILAVVFLLIILYACSAGEVLPSQAPSAALPSEAPPVSASPSPETTAPPVPAVSAVPTVSPEPSEAFVGQVVCTADEYVNIRERADTDSPVAGTLPAGETADLIEYTDGWARISYQGTAGYVRRDYLISSSAPDVPVPTGDWDAILVNPTNYLPQDFSVTLENFEGGEVDERILKICREMFDDARKDGISLELVDAYRSYDRQNELYQQKVDSFTAKGLARVDAETQAATITARPDTSEHQTGLALDIVTSSYTSRDKGFAETKAFKWLDANAQNYGFTLRYKQDKSEITKVIYEPWHWRFVGVEAAAQMKKSGECLEEYLGASN